MYIKYVLHVCFGSPKKTLSSSYELIKLFETPATFGCT